MMETDTTESNDAKDKTDDVCEDITKQLPLLIKPQTVFRTRLLQIDKCLPHFKRLAEEYASLSKQVKELNERNNHQEKDCKEKESVIESLQKEIDQRKKANKEKVIETEDLRKELDEINDRLKNECKEKDTVLENLRKELEEKNIDLKKGVKEKETEILNLREKNVELEKKCKAKENEFINLWKELDEKNVELEKERKENESEIVKLRKELNDKNANKKNAELVKLRKELKEVKKNIGDAEKKHETEKKELQSKIEELLNEKDRFNEKLTVLENKNKELLKDNKRLNVDIRELKELYDSLQETKNTENCSLVDDLELSSDDDDEDNGRNKGSGVCQRCIELESDLVFEKALNFTKKFHVLTPIPEEKFYTTIAVQTDMQVVRDYSMVPSDRSDNRLQPSNGVFNNDVLKVLVRNRDKLLMSINSCGYKQTNAFSKIDLESMNALPEIMKIIYGFLTEVVVCVQESFEFMTKQFNKTRNDDVVAVQEEDRNSYFKRSIVDHDDDVVMVNKRMCSRKEPDYDTMYDNMDFTTYNNCDALISPIKSVIVPLNKSGKKKKKTLREKLSNWKPKIPLANNDNLVVNKPIVAPKPVTVNELSDMERMKRNLEIFAKGKKVGKLNTEFITNNPVPEIDILYDKPKKKRKRVDLGREDMNITRILEEKKKTAAEAEASVVNNDMMSDSGISENLNVDSSSVISGNVEGPARKRRKGNNNRGKKINFVKSTDKQELGKVNEENVTDTTDKCEESRCVLDKNEESSSILDDSESIPKGNEIVAKIRKNFKSILEENKSSEVNKGKTKATANRNRKNKSVLEENNCSELNIPENEGTADKSEKSASFLEENYVAEVNLGDRCDASRSILEENVKSDVETDRNENFKSILEENQSRAVNNEESRSISEENRSRDVHNEESRSISEDTTKENKGTRSILEENDFIKDSAEKSKNFKSFLEENEKELESSMDKNRSSQEENVSGDSNSAVNDENCRSNVEDHHSDDENLDKSEKNENFKSILEENETEIESSGSKIEESRSTSKENDTGDLNTAETERTSVANNNCRSNFVEHHSDDENLDKNKKFKSILEENETELESSTNKIVKNGSTNVYSDSNTAETERRTDANDNGRSTFEEYYSDDENLDIKEEYKSILEGNKTELESSGNKIEKNRSTSEENVSSDSNTAEIERRTDANDNCRSTFEEYHSDDENLDIKEEYKCILEANKRELESSGYKIEKNRSTPEENGTGKSNAAETELTSVANENCRSTFQEHHSDNENLDKIEENEEFKSILEENHSSAINNEESRSISEENNSTELIIAEIKAALDENEEFKSILEKKLTRTISNEVDKSITEESRSNSEENNSTGLIIAKIESTVDKNEEFKNILEEKLNRDINNEVGKSTTEEFGSNSEENNSTGLIIAKIEAAVDKGEVFRCISEKIEEAEALLDENKDSGSISEDSDSNDMIIAETDENEEFKNICEKDSSDMNISEGFRSILEEEDKSFRSNLKDEDEDEDSSEQLFIDHNSREGEVSCESDDNLLDSFGEEKIDKIQSRYGIVSSVDQITKNNFYRSNHDDTSSNMETDPKESEKVSFKINFYSEQNSLEKKLESVEENVVEKVEDKITVTKKVEDKVTVRKEVKEVVKFNKRPEYISRHEPIKIYKNRIGVLSELIKKYQFSSDTWYELIKQFPRIPKSRPLRRMQCMKTILVDLFSNENLTHAIPKAVSQIEKNFPENAEVVFSHCLLYEMKDEWEKILEKNPKVVLNILAIVRHLAKMYEGFMDYLLPAISYRMFRLKQKFDDYYSLLYSQVYIALCLQQRYVEKLIVFLVDSMYCLHKQCYRIVWQMLNACPDILQSYYPGIKENILHTTIKYLLLNFKSGGVKVFLNPELVKIRQHVFYNYRLPEYAKTVEGLLEKLLAHAKDDPSVEVFLSVTLLARREDVAWVMNKIINQGFLALLQEGWNRLSIIDDPHEKTKVVHVMKLCVDVLGATCRTFDEANADKTIAIICFLKTILAEKDLIPELQEAIVSALIQLARHQYENVVEVLISWTPNFLPSKQLLNRLKRFLSMKSRMYWNCKTKYDFRMSTL